MIVSVNSDYPCAVNNVGLGYEYPDVLDRVKAEVSVYSTAPKILILSFTFYTASLPNCHCELPTSGAGETELHCIYSCDFSV